MIDKDRIEPKSSAMFLPSWASHIGLAAATAQENDLEIRGKIQTAQVMTVISWCTYPGVYLFPMLGINAAQAVVAIHTSSSLEKSQVLINVYLS